ncbi:tRNA(Met) cytidine acetyltransferase TmcA [Sodalis sp. RH20]|uniref:tRNA(Met) cytidine acetyltransferase TmcA n=1 Tax=unclassified Sodalis (in: enterobacteria) TaxID=2636512 RepID=UPI0039B3905D
MTDPWRAATARMRRAGVRRLLVVSGDAEWSLAQAQMLRGRLPGDWPWIGAPPEDWPLCCAPAAFRMLLGREFRHAVFDARHGLAVDALAALAGTLRAGSWLVLLVPEWTSWPTRPDIDSLRWSERPVPMATPHFVAHFRQSLLADPGVALLRQHQPQDAIFAPQPVLPRWRPPAPGPTDEQRAVLSRLQATETGIFVLTAPRGRGKSTLAGMLAARSEGRCWATAPAKATAEVLERHAGHRVRFFAPDALLLQCRHHPAADWLLVDEAAAIPMPLLRELLGYFPRVLLTTTVQGYEGTGRGFLLKFCATLPRWHHLTLEHPLRWAKDDPLERWLGAALLFAEPAERDAAPPDAAPALTRPSREHWLSHPRELQAFYQLLASAHYRTTPLDLRRLMDAPGQYFIAARSGDRLTGALWSVAEGGLPPALAHEVWAGRRRPAGSLVAQSLAAHGGLWTAPCLRSRRISRIAVTAAGRRRGWGRQLVACMVAGAAPLDFVSVSFGLTAELWRFWQAVGFHLVHIGTHREASSGCYSAMALYPLSSAGHRLAAQGAALLTRDGVIHADAFHAAGAGGGHGCARPAADELDDDDWRNLAGFAFARRTPEACRMSLSRLLRRSDLPLAALRLWLEQRLDVNAIVEQTGLSGKKAVITRWREETARALEDISSDTCRRWRDWSAPGGHLQGA